MKFLVYKKFYHVKLKKKGSIGNVKHKEEKKKTKKKQLYTTSLERNERPVSIRDDSIHYVFNEFVFFHLFFFFW